MMRVRASLWLVLSLTGCAAPGYHSSCPRRFHALALDEGRCGQVLANWDFFDNSYTMFPEVNTGSRCEAAPQACQSDSHPDEYAGTNKNPVDVVFSAFLTFDAASRCTDIFEQSVDYRSFAERAPRASVATTIATLRAESGDPPPEGFVPTDLQRAMVHVRSRIGGVSLCHGSFVTIQNHSAMGAIRCDVKGNHHLFHGLFQPLNLWIRPSRGPRRRSSAHGRVSRGRAPHGPHRWRLPKGPVTS